MVFKSRQKNRLSTIKLSLTSSPLLVSETSFLCVPLDDNLTWKPHISLVANKISKSIGIIHKSSFFLISRHSLHTLYNSTILPYLNYCTQVWGAAYKSSLQRIFILQKRALRIISKSKVDVHTDPIFKVLKLLKCQDIYLFQLGLFMFSFKSSTINIPPKFDNVFLRNNQIHSYNTRKAHSFNLPLCRTNIRKFSIFYQGPNFFNSLNPEIQ